MEGPYYEELLDHLMIRHLNTDQLMSYLEHGELDMLAQDVVIQRIKDLKDKGEFDYIKYHEKEKEGLTFGKIYSGTHNWLYYEATYEGKQIKVRISTLNLKQLEVLNNGNS